MNIFTRRSSNYISKTALVPLKEFGKMVKAGGSAIGLSLFVYFSIILTNSYSPLVNSSNQLGDIVTAFLLVLSVLCTIVFSALMIYRCCERYQNSMMDDDKIFIMKHGSTARFLKKGISPYDKKTPIYWFRIAYSERDELIERLVLRGYDYFGRPNNNWESLRQNNNGQLADLKRIFDDWYWYCNCDGRGEHPRVGELANNYAVVFPVNVKDLLVHYQGNQWTGLLDGLTITDEDDFFKTKLS